MDLTLSESGKYATPGPPGTTGAVHDITPHYETVENQYEVVPFETRYSIINEVMPKACTHNKMRHNSFDL